MVFDIRTLEHDHPVLEQSRLMSVFYLAQAYIAEHGSIGLTKSNAFNRKFCHWTAETYDWPDYSAEFLLKIQRTLNELDVSPVFVMHDICTQWRPEVRAAPLPVLPLTCSDLLICFNPNQLVYAFWILGAERSIRALLTANSP